MKQIPADLPPRWFLGVIHELSIDAVTGMVKVTAEDGHITYIQPARALKLAEWALACKDQLAEAQTRLDAEVQATTGAAEEGTIYRFHLGKHRVAGAESRGAGRREDAALCSGFCDATGAYLPSWLCTRE
jgi:hypothetical protein